VRRTIAVDASFLIAFLDRNSRTQAVANLIHQLSAENAKVIIPTPVLAEVLTKARSAAPVYMEQINKCACFQVRPFDDKASIELTKILGDGAAGIRDILRFDRQIVAIAKVNGAAALYSDNDQIAEFATVCGIPSKRLKDLG
jgi:predicted nucleic acid-binding protein